MERYVRVMGFMYFTIGVFTGFMKNRRQGFFKNKALMV